MARKHSVTQSSGNVFADLGFSTYEAEKLSIKSALMRKIESYIKSHDLTQDQAAQIMGVGRTRISDVIRGKIDKFTIDALVDMLARAGYHLTVKVKAVDKEAA